MNKGILAIDVGGGTQDILLFEEGKAVENSVKVVLPSQTVIVANRIRKATGQGLPVFLNGNLMGGGACVGAVRAHLQSGLQVYATPDAALTINDDLQKVEKMGIKITANPPAGVQEIQMRDIDLESLEKALAMFGVEIPDQYAVAVQDHGEAIGQSNRDLRFQQWRKFIERGGDIKDLAFFDIPFHFTRMRAAQKDLTGALLMDTGSAAIWGALCDPEVKAAAKVGITLLNIGNQHTIGVLLKDYKVYGLFEHHTRLLNRDEIKGYVLKLQQGLITHEEVFNSNGHGAYVSAEAKAQSFDKLIVVTGPNRQIMTGEQVYFAAPYGDMMLAGSFGLVRAYYEKQGRVVPEMFE